MNKLRGVHCKPIGRIIANAVGIWSCLSLHPILYDFDDN